MKIRILEPATLRAPGTGRRRVVLGVTLWAAGLSGAAWVLALISPCDFYWAADTNPFGPCNTPSAGVIRLIESINFMGAYLVLMYLYGQVIIQASRFRRARPTDTCSPVELEGPSSACSNGRRSRGNGLTTSHWTAAASTDVFLQAARTLQNIRISVAPFMLLQALISVLSHAISWGTGNPASNNPDLGVNTVCAEGINLCRIAWHGDVLVLSINISLLLYFILVTVLSPDNLWSPVTLAAIRQTREWRMARMRQLPYFMLFPVGMDFLIVVNYAIFDPTKVPATQYAVFFANCIVDVYLISILIWIFFPCGAPKPTLDMEDDAEIRPLVGKSIQSSPLDPASSTLLQSFVTRLQRLVRTRENGVRLQRQVLLILLASMLTQRESFDMYLENPALVAIQWLVRLATFLGIVLMRDEEADFDTLDQTGAAFGLVVDANDLKKVLYHTLKHGRPSPSRVRTYKGSLLRMKETMSVSYRWQKNERPVAAGLGINMSTWQLHNVHDALVDTNCKYVWLDHFSVPQTQCTLQETLLSRMMAVYAASGCTLVLRSREPDGSRYHQRGWTVQEFCSCTKAAVRTERVSPESMMVLRRSRLQISVYTSAEDPDEDEERYFGSLREWHLERAANCMPLWLSQGTKSGGAVDDTTLEKAVVTYMDLSSRVATKEPKDLVRALVPMLTNCPVETQAELVELLRLLDGKASLPSIQNQLQLFLRRPRKSSNMMTLNLVKGSDASFTSLYNSEPSTSLSLHSSSHGGTLLMPGTHGARPSDVNAPPGPITVNVLPSEGSSHIDSDRADFPPV